MSAEALRRRMAHGNVYPPERIDAALANFCRVGNLTALREIALPWAADRVDEALLRYREERGIQEPWATRERVLVTLSGGPEGETLIRRGERIASRRAGGEMLAVHVMSGDGLVTASPQLLDRQRALVESLGGSYHTLVGDEPAEAVLDFARQANATEHPPCWPGSAPLPSPRSVSPRPSSPRSSRYKSSSCAVCRQPSPSSRRPSRSVSPGTRAPSSSLSCLAWAPSTSRLPAEVGPIFDRVESANRPPPSAEPHR